MCTTDAKKTALDTGGKSVEVMQRKQKRTFFSSITYRRHFHPCACVNSVHEATVSKGLARLRTVCNQSSWGKGDVKDARKAVSTVCAWKQQLEQVRRSLNCERKRAEPGFSGDNASALTQAECPVEEDGGYAPRWGLRLEQNVATLSTHPFAPLPLYLFLPLWPSLLPFLPPFLSINPYQPMPRPFLMHKPAWSPLQVIPPP
eukprot:CAMPEP_0177609168 /NCGR_PEP_ID=MMETSP0419_2-20121207/18916_1 /TAXON_ID=582737 /ORGANISM="Tetraselmis sp., Strain GSL018" /LENGTH=201 /DNA_ID=CAMNT_0019104017 /DNA_START=209 /DNA_END=811 /DNA_ORIENTATION=-